MRAPLPPNEAERLETLLSYNILDTAREQVFDNLTLLAAHICQTPISLVSFVDERRQWFKSRLGLEALETSRDLAFCAYTILKPDEVLEVRDAQLDPRFADNSLVTGDPNIRFYAGAPLVAFDGHALGTLCVIDRIPRTLSTEQRTALRALAHAAVTQLDLHRVLAAQRCAERELLHTKEELESAYALLEQKVAMRTSELLQEIEERKQLQAVTVESRRALLGILEDQQRAELELQESQQQLETLSRRLLAAQETERRHIARELHDEIGQLLTVVKLDLQTVLRQNKSKTLNATVSEGMESIDRVIARVRDLSLDLRPSMLDDLGLVPALRWLVQRQVKHLEATIDLDLPTHPPRFPDTVETACFRIVQEALTNILRYANAKAIHVALALHERDFEVSIKDDGVGFDLTTIRSFEDQGTGFGLLGMRERAELAGGQFKIFAAPGQGCSVTARFPRATDADQEGML